MSPQSQNNHWWERIRTATKIGACILLILEFGKYALQYMHEDLPDPVSPMELGTIMLVSLLTGITCATLQVKWLRGGV